MFNSEQLSDSCDTFRGPSKPLSKLPPGWPRSDFGHILISLAAVFYREPELGEPYLPYRAHVN
jgi:hypothetical protein